MIGEDGESLLISIFSSCNAQICFCPGGSTGHPLTRGLYLIPWLLQFTCPRRSKCPWPRYWTSNCFWWLLYLHVYVSTSSLIDPHMNRKWLLATMLQALPKLLIPIGGVNIERREGSFDVLCAWYAKGFFTEFFLPGDMSPLWTSELDVDSQRKGDNVAHITRRKDCYKDVAF